MLNISGKTVLGMLCAASMLIAQDKDKPFPAHHVIGNVYYVGSTEYASYLITTPSGHILINSSFESTVPWIRESVEKLGFKFQDIKILLTSHAHADHVAGNFLVQELTGAKAMVMQGDEDLVRNGGKNDFQYGDKMTFKPSRVDHVLHDGEEVKLGGAVLTAHLTPGHTRGCTTWTMKVKDGGKDYDVVIVGSPNVNPGYRLVGNEKYPKIAADFAHTFEVLKSLHCDVFLGAHGAYYGMADKYKRMKEGGKNPFVDPDGYKAYVADREAAYRKELERQRAGQSGR